MGIRKAYVDWQKLTEHTKLTNRKEYMVCVPSEDGTGSFSCATWYEKGTVIHVPMADDMVPDGMEPTAEERLLRALFGATRPFVIPEDGFYQMICNSDCLRNGSNDEFGGCPEEAVCVGNRYGWDGGAGALPVYWAETPLLPEGLHADGCSGRIRRPDDEKMKEQDRDLLERISGDAVANAAYRGLCEEAVPGDDAVDLMIGQAVYSITPRQAGTTVDSAWAMCRAIAAVSDQEFLRLKRDMKGKKAEEAERVLRSFCKRWEIPGFQLGLLFRYMDYLLDDCRGFYDYRDRRLTRGGLGSLHMPAVLQEAWARASLPYRVGRFVKLLQIGAPEIILANELRVLAERLLAAKDGDRIVYVGPDFDAMYGVLPDGSRGERHCEYGDKELQLVPKEPDPDGEFPEGDGDAMEMELPEEETKEDEGTEETPEPVLGVDYPWFAVLPAPNFLMRKCRFVLWDNEKAAYLRDADGNVEPFADWKDAKVRSEALGRAAEAAKNGNDL